MCEDWERAVEQIAGERQVAEFLKRWFGYCATGDISEQVFVVHWGDGSNGKSTILNTVSAVLGDYAGTAAPQLLASSSTNGSEAHPDRHRRPVGQAHGDGPRDQRGCRAARGLHQAGHRRRQDQGRFMRADFFEFDPTHKIQLLTNSKPSVRGRITASGGACCWWRTCSGLGVRNRWRRAARRWWATSTSAPA